MATYVILNLVFMVVVYAATYAGFRKPGTAVLVTLIALLLLTAVFDNVIVGLLIVDYDPAKILGVYVGVAPIEDFMYAILAVLLVPAVWHKLGAKHAK